MVGEGGWRLPDDLDVFGQSAPFSDAAPVLLTAQPSLVWLRERADEPFGMDRFRPNLVVDGTEPWEEDTWSTIRIGEAELRCAVPWPRCTIPQIDQLTADRHREPAKVLRRHRWCTEAPTVRAGFRGIRGGQQPVRRGVLGRPPAQHGPYRRRGNRDVDRPTVDDNAVSAVALLAAQRVREHDDLALSR